MKIAKTKTVYKCDFCNETVDYVLPESWIILDYFTNLSQQPYTTNLSPQPYMAKKHACGECAKVIVKMLDILNIKYVQDYGYILPHIKTYHVNNFNFVWI